MESILRRAESIVNNLDGDSEWNLFINLTVDKKALRSNAGIHQGRLSKTWLVISKGRKNRCEKHELSLGVSAWTHSCMMNADAL